MHERKLVEISQRFVQVIGVAYTYRPSLAVRHHLTQKTPGHHSAQTADFSYFYKGNNQSVVGNLESLSLRVDPLTGQLARHWPEPELAVLLGDEHKILAYTLANDLTAISVEVRGRTTESDGTYLGKVWSRSGSLGPRFISAASIDPSDLIIGLRIERGGLPIYDQTYSTSRRLRTFEDIPEQVVRRHKSYSNTAPMSKRIATDAGGFLVPGTVIMLGTGLIVSERYSSQPGDRVTVYCSEIGELTNPLACEAPSSR
jgi:fumarylacetoacetate (FAA) hydrolase family protein